MKDKRVLAGVAVLLLAAFWFYIKPTFFAAKPPPVYTEEQLSAAPKPTVQLEERVLNLKAPASSPNYVKLVLAIQFTDPKHTYLGLKGEALTAKNLAFLGEIKPELPRVWDSVTTILASKTVDQVSAVEGRDQLKALIVEAINKDLHELKVANVYFVTFITQ